MEIISLKDVKSMLGISRSSIYRLIDSKEIPYYKIGGSLRFDRSEIEKFIRSCKVE